MDEAGMTRITLDEEPGKRLVAAYYNTIWENIISKSPDYGQRLRDLSGT